MVTYSESFMSSQSCSSQVRTPSFSLCLFLSLSLSLSLSTFLGFSFCKRKKTQSFLKSAVSPTCSFRNTCLNTSPRSFPPGIFSLGLALNMEFDLSFPFCLLLNVFNLLSVHFIVLMHYKNPWLSTNTTHFKARYARPLCFSITHCALANCIRL